MSLSRRERREQRMKLLKEKRLKQLADEAPNPIFQKQDTKGLLGIYDRHYLILLVIPIILLVISLAQIGIQVANTGEFLNKGVTLTGGVVITIPVETPVNIDEIHDLLTTNFPNDQIDVRASNDFGVQKAIIVATDKPEDTNEILKLLEQKIPNAVNLASAENTGSALGQSFFQETTKAMIFAFVFMGLVVFISFRTVTPSIMVILSVIATTIETIATINLLGVKVSTAGIAALLMLIGYSVDTDILLTSRVLRSKEGSVFTRIVDAAKTGLMLTATAIASVLVGFLMTQNETIKEIMLILLIGLLYDIINTWIQNVALLRYYVENIVPKKNITAAQKAEMKEEKRRKDEEKLDKELGLEAEEEKEKISNEKMDDDIQELEEENKEDEEDKKGVKNE